MLKADITYGVYAVGNIRLTHDGARRIGERFLGGVLLRTGQAGDSLGERIQAAPISTLWA